MYAILIDDTIWREIIFIQFNQFCRYAHLDFELNTYSVPLSLSLWDFKQI